MENHLSEKFKSKSASDFAYLHLKEMIITGELPPEESIVEQQLASKLEISRTPLREALQRLEIEELVVRKMNGRLQVAKLSIKEVKELFTVRKKLEGIIAVEATERVTDQDINHLKTLVVMITETFKQNNIEQVLHFGSQFHTYLYELSNNYTVIKILNQLNDHILRYRYLIPSSDKNRMEASIIEHEKILKYMTNRDKEGARIALEEHIENSLTEAIKSIKKMEI